MRCWLGPTSDRGGADAARAGDLLRAVFHPFESRRVNIAGITVHPDERWMQQIARNVTMEGCGALRDCRYLLHDRDTKYTLSSERSLHQAGSSRSCCPRAARNLNAYAERWVRSVKEECL